MFVFSQSVRPAAKAHLDAQLAFFNDLSRSWFRSFQQLVDLNLQLGQTLIEESTTASHEILTSQRQSDMIGAAASRAQPTAEKMRSYQQHLSRLAADTQVEMAKVTEDHVAETTRTARTLADEVVRNATEETEKSMRNQQDNMKKFRDPFESFSNGAQGRGNEMRSGASMQSAESQSQGGASQGSASQTTTAGTQTGSSRQGATRKDT
jgi:phasin family protein